MKMSASLFVLLLSCGAASAGQCAGRTSRYAFGGDSSGSYATRAGEACTILVTSGGAISSLVVSQKPAHGSATATGGSGISYKPASGFSGSDSFVYTVKGEGARSSGTSNIAITMSVN